MCSRSGLFTEFNPYASSPKSCSLLIANCLRNLGHRDSTSDFSIFLFLIFGVVGPYGPPQKIDVRCSVVGRSAHSLRIAQRAIQLARQGWDLRQESPKQSAESVLRKLPVHLQGQTPVDLAWRVQCGPARPRGWKNRAHRPARARVPASQPIRAHGRAELRRGAG